MPYSAQINRVQPTAFVFLIDQSGSMDEKMPSGETKAEFVAKVLNKTIYRWCILFQKANEGVRDYFDLAVVAYGGNGIASGFGGALAHSMFHPLSKVEQNPLRIDIITKRVSDGAGGLVEEKIRFPVWVDPRGSGGTPMCEALKKVAALLVDWCNTHESSYPPTVIHVTDGASGDGDPEAIARQVQQISTSDGQCLLFNLHIDATERDGLMFPSSESVLPDANSQMLFRCSSPFPPQLIKPAQEKGYPVSSTSKFFGYRVNIEGIVDFFDIGTRTSAAQQSSWFQFDA